LEPLSFPGAPTDAGAPTDREALRDPGASWSYARLSPGSRIEVARWSGQPAPRLHPHFHDEVQLALVVRGVRAFEVRGRVLTAGAGQLLVIPAGCAHASVPVGAADNQCVNVYLDPMAWRPRDAAVLPLPEGWTDAGRLRIDVLVAALRVAVPAGAASACAVSAGAALSDVPAPQPARSAMAAASNDRVSDIARRQGMTREAFSRAFTRATGLPPHGYRTIARLNEARQQLRGNAPIAEIAAAAGFADQSHFGRLFRRTFGTTPARYRKQMG
jgi:AraC-like DNA-binding protein/quercetin dioxygenase-like cupin family protein